MSKYLILLILLPFILVSCVDNSSNIPTETPLELKIGQMIMVGFRDTLATDAFPATLTSQLESGKVGGVLFLGYNFVDSVQSAAIIHHFKYVNSRLMPFLALDQEGGRVQRLNATKGFRNYPSAKITADSLTTNEAFQMYQDMAHTLSVLGININLAPCVDVDVNPDSPVIGAYGRSFSHDPIKVTRYATSLINAHKLENVLTCLKHFPGHGSAEQDSHLGVTDITNTWIEYELDPYKDLIAAGYADFVMPGHLFNLNVDTAYPASLSEKFIRKKLRQELGFKGIVISDDLQMGAIRDHYTFDEIVVQAIKAGNDILLFSNYAAPDPLLPEKIIEAVKKAIDEGKITKSQIDESYSRILNLKNKLKNLPQ